MVQALFLYRVVLWANGACRVGDMVCGRECEEKTVSVIKIYGLRFFNCVHIGRLMWFYQSLVAFYEVKKL